MNGPEKRHFKLQAQVQKRKGGAQFLLLFDLLANSVDLDEEEVCRKMEWREFAPNYSTAKRFLEEKVLSSLEEYQKEKSETQKIQKMIRQIRVLRDRRMDDLAGSKVRKAMRRARKVQNPVLALEILLEQRTLMLRDGRKVFRRKDLAALTKEIEDATNGIRLEQSVRDMHYQFYSLLVLKGAFLTEEVAKELEGCLSRLGEVSFENPYSFLPRYYDALVRQQNCYVHGDVEGSREILGQVVELFDQYPDMVREHGGKYLSSIHNLLGRLLLLNAHADFIPYMDRIRAFHPRSPRLVGQRLETYFCLGLAMLANSGQLKENQGFLKQAQDVVEEQKHLFSRRMGIQAGFLVATCLALEGKLESSLKAVMDLLGNETLQRIQLIHRALRLMWLVLLYDANKWDLLDYQLRSRKEGLRGKSGFEVEHGFLEALGQVIKMPLSSNKAPLWDGLLVRTVELANVPEENSLLSTFNFEAWLRSKRDGTEFLAAVQGEWATKGGGRLCLLPLEQPLG